MSSSQDCRCERCQQTFHQQAKRFHNNICSNRRQDIRHHHGKRRCPPTKKDLFPKDISLKGKFNKKTQYHNIPHFLLISDRINQQKNNAATPSKYKVQDQNPITKLNSNTTFGIQNILHAVGQSQRQKLMKCSPSPNSFNENQNITKNQSLTDRDRKINDPIRSHVIINMQKKRAISQLDENFLKNFINPQKKIQQVQQASPSEQKSDK